MYTYTYAYNHVLPRAGIRRVTFCPVSRSRSILVVIWFISTTATEWSWAIWFSVCRKIFIYLFRLMFIHMHIRIVYMYIYVHICINTHIHVLHICIVTHIHVFIQWLRTCATLDSTLLLEVVSCRSCLKWNAMLSITMIFTCIYIHL
jgi:hypothetical protein